MKTYLLTVSGFTPTKKNGKNAWRGRVVIDPEKKRQVEGIEWELRRQWANRPALKRVAIRATFVITHHRCDLDGKYTTIQDALKKAGVIVNDNTKHVLRFAVGFRKGDRDECVVQIRELPEEPKKTKWRDRKCVTG